MGGKKWILGCFLLMPWMASAGEPKEWATAKADGFLDRLFDHQRRISRFEARYKTTSTGGLFKRPQISFSQAFYDASGRYRIIDEGKTPQANPRKTHEILYDGTLFWDAEPEEEFSRRIVVRRMEPGPDSERIGWLAVFVPGAANTRDLRLNYNVSMQNGEKGAVRLRLTRPGEPGKVREFRFGVGSLMPDRISIVHTTRKALSGKVSRETQEFLILKLRSNLESLPPFAPERFRLKLTAKDKVFEPGLAEALTPQKLNALRAH